MKRLVIAGLAAISAAVVCMGGLSSASATGTASLDLYFSAPFVQGSEVTTGNSESFDAFSTGTNACNTTWGSIGTATGDCNVSVANSPGGASAGPTDSTPTYGGSGSNYPYTEWTGRVSLKSITVTFAAPVKYVGFWWSAGNGADVNSYTNQVDFYSGSTLVATMTAEDVTNIIGTLPNPYPGPGTVNSVGGTPYTLAYYFGNPRAYPSLTPTEPLNTYAWSGEAIFTYLNLYVTGDYSIDSMVISGDGFEFDNVVTSTETQTPSQDLVFAKTIDVTPPDPTPTPTPAPNPDPDNGGGAGLPDTGLAIMTFAGITVLGVFLFLLAGGAFNSRTRLRLFGVDLEVKDKLDRLSQSLTRMERKRPRIRRRDHS